MSCRGASLFQELAREGAPMNRRIFDLILAETVGILAVVGGAKIWARQRLIMGKPTGLIHGTATVVKALA